MNKTLAVIICALLASSLLYCRPAGAEDLLPQLRTRSDLTPEYRMFIPGQLRLEDLEDSGASADTQEKQTKNNNQKKSRLGVSISRLVTGKEKVDPLEDDKVSKWNMLKSLPSDFANAQNYQDRLAVFGKIFEPKVTLDIEF